MYTNEEDKAKYVRDSMSRLATASGAELQGLEAKLGVTVGSFRDKLKEMELESQRSSVDASGKTVGEGDKLLGKVKSMYAEMDQAQKRGELSLKENMNDIDNLQAAVGEVKSLSANQLKALLSAFHSTDTRLVDAAFERSKSSKDRTATLRDVVAVFVSYVEAYMKESTKAMKVIKTELGALADKAHGAVRDLTKESEQYAQAINQEASSVDAARQSAVQDSLSVRAALRREAVDLQGEEIAQKQGNSDDQQSLLLALEGIEEVETQKRSKLTSAVQKWVKEHMAAYAKGLAAIQKKYNELNGRK
jgi:hypothetical protein